MEYCIHLQLKEKYICLMRLTPLVTEDKLYLLYSRLSELM